MPFATRDKRNGINLYSSSTFSTHRINCAAFESQEEKWLQIFGHWNLLRKTFSHCPDQNEQPHRIVETREKQRKIIRVKC